MRHRLGPFEAHGWVSEQAQKAVVAAVLEDVQWRPWKRAEVLPGMLGRQVASELQKEWTARS